MADPIAPVYVNFCDLPNELMIKILALLDLASLLRCKAVCRLLHALIEDSVVLQYNIQLITAGMTDGPSTNPHPISTRLQLLKQYQRLWSQFPLPPSPTSSSTNLNSDPNGRWIKERSVPMFDGHLWELYGNVLAHSLADEKTLVFRQLESRVRGIEEKVWQVTVEFNVRDFGMDPAADLLVVIERRSRGSKLPPTHCRVHFLSLSTGQLHPLSRQPGQVTFQLSGDGRSDASYTIIVCGDHLGLSVRSGGLRGRSTTDVGVWNWKTLEMETRIQEQARQSFHAFSFLSPSHILLSVTDMVSDVISSYLVAIDFKRAPRDFKLPLRPSTDSPNPDHHSYYLSRFALPPMRAGLVPLEIMVRTDPAPGWKPAKELAVPFHVSGKERVIVVPVVATDGARLWLMVLFVLAETLTSRLGIDVDTVLEEKEEEEEVIGRYRDYDWEEWGPKETRLVPQMVLNSVWVCYVYGTRVVLPHGRAGSDREFKVFDFNQLALRKQVSDEEKAGDEILAHTRMEEERRRAQAHVPGEWNEEGSGGGSGGSEGKDDWEDDWEDEEGMFPVTGRQNATVDGDESCFEGDVETELPYRVKIVKLGGPRQDRANVMIAEDSVITVQLGRRWGIMSI